jgi:TonB family protein
VRCVGCETEPLTSTQYCESCGIRVWRQDTQGLETAPVTGVDHWASDSNPTSDARCESCGGPGTNGDLCESCQRAFFSSWLEGAAPAAPVSDATTPLAAAAPIQESARSELVTSVTAANDLSDAATLAVAAVPVATLGEAAMTSAEDRLAAVRAEVNRAAEARAKTVRTEEANIQATLAKGTRTDTHVAKAPKPAVVNQRENVPVSSQHGQSIALAGVAVVVAAICVGAYWLQFHEQPVIVLEEPQTPVAKNAPATHRPPGSGRSAAAATGRKSAAAPPEVPASTRPKPAASAPAQAPAKAVRPPSSSTRQVASVSVPKPATEAPPPAVAPSIPDVVAAVPPPAPPVGRFFETMDVNESPQVATRVEPQLPDELRVRPLNEIVIVRVLVSQGGHPSRISLLRRSKTGPRLDDAVIAAVNQWTFSPAKKRGEAVSCWFNFGVPIG